MGEVGVLASGGRGWPMKNPVNTRKGDAIRFGLFGAATFPIFFWIQVNWLTVAAWLMGRDRLIFEGTSRAQLEALLGVPPETPYFREYDYVYWLGPERGFISIDSEWLVVKINEGVVVTAKIVKD